MAEKKKIDPELNRERVRKSMKKIDRLNIYLPKGTIDEISELGFKPSTFARTVVLEELKRLKDAEKNK